MSFIMTFLYMSIMYIDIHPPITFSCPSSPSPPGLLPLGTLFWRELLEKSVWAEVGEIAEMKLALPVPGRQAL
jgi:hypothetical protein